jgi:hypothetical protein
MIRTLLNDELERMWKEAVIAYFKIISLQHLPRGTEENHEKPQDSQCSG